MASKEWKELELIVAEIQKQLAPTTTVEHNKKVIGNSGRTRKLDVAVSTSVGTSSIFIVFDCKHHKKPVTLEDVAAFSVQVEDVNANLGVMVSSSGFDAGAKAIAKQKNILLQNYRKAGENDWNSILGDKAWMMIIGMDLLDPVVLANLSSHPNKLVGLSLNSLLFDEHGKEYSSILKSFWESWKASGERLGDVIAEATFSKNPAAFIQTEDGTMIQIYGVKVVTKVIARQYIVNMNFSTGDVIENDNKGNFKYRSLKSEPVDWMRIVENQPGKELSAEEYMQIKQQPKAFDVPLNKDKRYFRVIVKETHKD